MISSCYSKHKDYSFEQQVNNKIIPSINFNKEKKTSDCVTTENYV